jgi:hypothetical protein
LAYEDDEEKLAYSGSLQLKKFKLPRPVGEGWINWFDQDAFEPCGLKEINLLNEYQDPKKDRTDFWMEPGEVYRLGVPLVLRDGCYLAKVTFIGKGSDSNFWSRIVLVQTPEKTI